METADGRLGKEGRGIYLVRWWVHLHGVSRDICRSTFHPRALGGSVVLQRWTGHFLSFDACKSRLLAPMSMHVVHQSGSHSEVPAAHQITCKNKHFHPFPSIQGCTWTMDQPLEKTGSSMLDKF